MQTALEMFRLHATESQRNIAEQLAITPAYMNDIFHGRRRLTAKILKRFPNGKAILLCQAREEAEREWEAANA